MYFTKTLAVLAALTGLLCTSAHATPINLVTNGDFETTTNGAGRLTTSTVATGWTTNGYNFLFAGNGADKNNFLTLWGPANGSLNGLGASPVGGNFIGADGAYGVGAIQQTIKGLVVGQQYDLSFYWAAAQQNGFSGVTTEKWNVSLGNQTISTATFTNANHGFSGWMYETFTYTATATTEVLSFLAYGTPNGEPPFSLLDGVSLKAKADIPEPSSTALFLGGLALLALAMRLSRRNGAIPPRQ